jgi:carbamoylphosphate synthase large subunit
MTPAPVIVGVNYDRFTIKASLADLNYVVPVPTGAEFVDAILDIVARDRINLIIGTDESVVKALSDSRDRFPFDLLLPSRETVDLCQDKHALNVFFRDRDIPVPRFCEVSSLDDLEGIFARFEVRRGPVVPRPPRVVIARGDGRNERRSGPLLDHAVAGFARNTGIRVYFGGIPAGTALSRNQRLVSRSGAVGTGD